MYITNPHNHPYISSCKLQFSEISTAAAYVRMVMCELCCVITATLYVYFVDQCHPFFILYTSNNYNKLMQPSIYSFVWGSLVARISIIRYAGMHILSILYTLMLRSVCREPD